MRLRLVTLTSLWLLSTSLAVPAGAGTDQPAGPVVVMNQNLYVGVDIFRILEAQSPAQIPAIAAAMLQTVFTTDFPSRAEVIADAVAAHRPHLVGLQEVALYRVQSPGDVLVGNPQPAQTVLLDFLQIVLDALAARGLDYVVAEEMVDADAELPFLAGFSDGVPLLDDVRLTDRNVILVRADIPFANASEVHFTHNLALNVGGVPLPFSRGYQSVDATVRGRTYRFANTHLEVGEALAGLRALQGLELAESLADASLPVILVGDLNANPGDPSPIPGVPSPWDLFAGIGYEDAWLRRVGAPFNGLTCCQTETLDNADPVYTSRVDFVLVRSDGSLGSFPDLGPVRMELLGDESGETTPAGLWPSDHAGLIARLLIGTPVPPVAAGRGH
jgi:endonuclease/exonuclease/phosphatase family metal-dependent hydrolase